MYEKSYMHRSPLTFVLYAKTDFLITASDDGVVKLWKKTPTDIDFVKAFKAHTGGVHSGSVDSTGSLLATIGGDDTVKVFNIESFDMTDAIDLPFKPTAVEWLSDKSQSSRLLALADATGTIHLYNPQTGERVAHRQVHFASVPLLRMHPRLPYMLSADAKGGVEVWGVSNEGVREFFDHPSAGGDVTYDSKLATGLVELMATRARVVDARFTPDGALLLLHTVTDRALLHKAKLSAPSGDAGTATVGIVYVFDARAGRLLRRVVEDVEAYTAGALGVDGVEMGKRLARERELEKAYVSHFAQGRGYPAQTLAVDVSGNFVALGTVAGVKLLNVHTGAAAASLGRVEGEERFTSLAMFQGFPRAIGATASSLLNAKVLQTAGEGAAEEACLFACAFKKPRVYCFSKREPLDEQRDVLNERSAARPAAKQSVEYRAARHVTLHTSLGDVRLELYPAAAPKTVHNFVSLCEQHYYNGCLFHRVIKGFMVQTGDAENNNGTGGQSVFGRNFEDEFSPSLRHDRAGVVSMANKGPGTKTPSTRSSRAWWRGWTP
jgi:peptidylprolyl isomerase domain and WD repeat-containing protein 1